jgi:hypothetical protein
MTKKKKNNKINESFNKGMDENKADKIIFKDYIFVNY